MQDEDPGFRRFVDETWAPLVRALDLYCGDRAMAEELAQEAFVRTYQRWPQVKHMARPGAWLHTVAFNLARSSFRRRAAERRAYQRHGTTPEVVAHDGHDDVLAIRAAVLDLPPRQREVVIQRFWFGRSVAETATVVGITPGAVKAATHKAVATLRERLDAVAEITEAVHE